MGRIIPYGKKMFEKTTNQIIKYYKPLKLSSSTFFLTNPIHPTSSNNPPAVQRRADARCIPVFTRCPRTRRWVPPSFWPPRAAGHLTRLGLCGPFTVAIIYIKLYRLYHVITMVYTIYIHLYSISWYDYTEFNKTNKAGTPFTIRICLLRTRFILYMFTYNYTSWGS